MRGDTSVAVIALRSTPVLMTGWKAEASATHTSRTRVRSMVRGRRKGWECQRESSDGGSFRDVESDSTLLVGQAL